MELQIEAEIANSGTEAETADSVIETEIEDLGTEAGAVDSGTV